MALIAAVQRRIEVPRPRNRRLLRAVAVGCGYAAAVRLMLVLVTIATLPIPQAGHLGHSHFDLFRMWANWDGVWYARIATLGYRGDPRRFAFFPLFPLTEAWLRGYLGGSADAAGVVVSLLASAAAFALLYERVSGWAGEAVAERTVRYLALFPTGLFFAVAYTEALFLALLLGCMQALGNRRWVAAGALGGLAALTRNAGVLLALPFAWTLYAGRAAWRRWWPVALVPAGLVAFMAYQAMAVSDPLAFIHVQAVWNRHVTWPWVTAGLVLRTALHGPQVVGNDANLAAALFAAAALLAGRRWIPVADQIIAWAIWGISVAAPALPPDQVLLSMDRFILVMYPVYAVLARWGERPRLDRALGFVMPLAQAALFVLFCHGYFVG